MAKTETGLFVFRRDLRIVDNRGLNLLAGQCERVYGIFIFTPEQVGPKNEYRSDSAVQFMIESLEDLSSRVSSSGGELMTFYGSNKTVVKECLVALRPSVICFNVDITPYAKARDAQIVKICKKMNVRVLFGEDYYLNHPGSVTNGSGSPYLKFTPYYNECRKRKILAPVATKIHFARTTKHINHRISLKQALSKFTKANPNILHRGGRANALRHIQTSAKNIARYGSTRDDLSKRTSELSAYIKFGCVSIREVCASFRRNRDFTRQLVWRDFYAGILDSFPRVLGGSFKPKYDKVRWRYNEEWFSRWCNGETGFPIVDAGMRQLNITGFMHNRARLIVASFLVKTLLIDWRLGEKYFASRLIDYDVASNNGNWQWIASSGVDSQPYFRIFNPWEQAKAHDPKCNYVKKWVPELSAVPAADILRWEITCDNYPNIGYFRPMVDYKKQKEIALKLLRG